MTTQTVPPTEVPRLVISNAATTSVSVAMQTIMTFDAAGDRLALITRIPKTGTLTAIEFRTGTVSTTGATFQIQVEGVDGTGLPDGVAKYTNANGTVVVATSDDGVWKSVSLNSGTGVSVTKGDLVAIVLSVSSGTPNTVIVQGGNVSSMTTLGTFPYMAQDTAGSWAKFASSALACPFVLSYGGTYELTPGANPTHSQALSSIGNGAERGLRFNFPVPVRAYGMRAFLGNIAAGADFRAVLYNDTPTLLTEVNSGADIDGDVAVSTTNDGWYEFIFPSAQSLSANTTYHATIYQKTANSVSLLENSFSSNAYMNAYHSGTAMYLSTRSGGTGAFTTTNTTMPMIQLLVDGFDDGLGGGRASLLLGI